MKYIINNKKMIRNKSFCHVPVVCKSQAFVMMYTMIIGYKFTEHPSWPRSSEKPQQNHDDVWVSIIYCLYNNIIADLFYKLCYDEIDNHL